MGRGTGSITTGRVDLLSPARTAATIKKQELLALINSGFQI